MQQLFQTELQVGLIGTEHLARLATLLLAHKTCLAKLVHDAPCAVKAHVQFALYERCRALLMNNHNAGSIGKERVEFIGRQFAT